MTPVALERNACDGSLSSNKKGSEFVALGSVSVADGSDNSQPSPKVMEATVKWLPLSDCLLESSEAESVASSSMCVEVEDEDTCQHGASGSPLIQKRTGHWADGRTSWRVLLGPLLRFGSVPSIYESVSSVLPWIEQQVQRRWEGSSGNHAVPAPCGAPSTRATQLWHGSSTPE